MDLLQDLPCYFLLAHREIPLCFLQEHICLANGQSRVFRDIFPPDGDGQHLRFQACTVAGGAGDFRHVVLIGLAHFVGIRLLVAAREQGQHPLEGHEVFLVFAKHIRVMEAVTLQAGAVQQNILRIHIQFVPACIEVIATLLQDRCHHAHGIGLAVLREGRKHPLPHGQGTIRQHQFLIEFHMAAQAGTDRTGTIGVIEGKHARCDFRQGDTAVHAGKIFAEHQQLAVHNLHIGHPVPQLQCCLQGVSQARLHAFAHNQTVNHHLDGVLLRLFKLDILIDIHDFPVHPHTHIALVADMLENFLVLPLLAAHHLGHDQQLCALRQFPELIQHLVYALLGDGLAAFRAVWPPCPCVEQAQVVVNLSHRADRGAWIVAGGLLVNGDSRRQAVYLIHIRLIHLAQELPCIRGQGLHIAPLPLCVNGIESKGRLA